jgi:1,2-diacylglycerol 3-alpha-glucosyltransferase
MCLSCFYIDGRSYQENQLIKQHVSAGHDVLVLASTETHSANGKLEYVAPARYLGAEGAEVVRLEYSGKLPHFIRRKLRMHHGVYDLLKGFSPDVILFHGTCGYELITCSNYVRDFPAVLFYVDSHEDWNNSARSLMSRELLHKIYYRKILNKSAHRIRKILCVSTEAIDFVEEVYGIPREQLEFYPLGGEPMPPDPYRSLRKRVRDELPLSDSTVVYLQSGKQTLRKKLLETLVAFLANRNRDAVLLVAGVLDDEIREEAEQLMSQDDRVIFLGWLDPKGLTGYLCAADVYLQPGTQSVTMQHSLCCHCAIAIADVPSHQPYYCENGWLLGDKTRLEEVFATASISKLEEMGEKSYKLASEMLDYAKLANRVLV